MEGERGAVKMKKLKQAMQSVVTFFVDVRAELSKVTFPSKQETIGATTVVIVFALILSLFVAIVDVLLIRLLRLVV